MSWSYESKRPGAVALTALLTSCVVEPVVSGWQANESSRAAAPRIEVVEAQGAPPVALLAREGDPEQVVAVALHGSISSLRVLAVSELVASRLRAKGFDVQLRSDRRSLMLTVGAAEQKPRELVQAIASALQTPVTAAEVAAVPSDLSSRVPMVQGEAERRIARCANRASRSEGESDSQLRNAGQLEEARRLLVSPSRMAFSAVGAPTFVKDVTDAVAQVGGWATTASEPEAPDANGPVLEVVAGGAPRLTLALRTSDGASALQRAKSFAEGPTAFSVQAERAGFSVSKVVGTVDPEGGCLTVTLEGQSATVDSVALGRVFPRLVDELRTSEPLYLDVRAQVANASDVREAAELAAWLTLSRRASSQDSALVAGLLAVRAEDWKTNESTLKRALVFTPNSEPLATPKTVLHAERGQPERWFLVANPCAGYAEGALNWGLSAVAAHSIGTLEIDGVRTEPFALRGAVGFVAREPAALSPLPASTLARRAMSGFFSLPRPAVERTRSFERLASELLLRFGPADLALSALPTAFDAHPGAFPLFAVPRNVSRYDEADLSLALHAAAEGPLMVAALGQYDDGLEAAAAAVARYRSQSKAALCPAPVPPKSGRLEVRAPGATAEVAVLIPTRGAYLAELLAELIRMRATKSLASLEGAGATVRVEVFSDYATDSVVVVLRGPAEVTLAREKELLAALREIAGPLPEDVLLEGMKRVSNRQRARLREPRERLSALLRGRLPEPPPAKLAEVVRDLTQLPGLSAPTVVVAKP